MKAIPGASSVIVGLSKSGYPADRFEFVGNIPVSRFDREQLLKNIKDSEATTVAYDNSTNIIKTLLSIEKVFGDK